MDGGDPEEALDEWKESPGNMGARRLFGSFLAAQKEHRTFRNGVHQL
jgi:hypothetical protein